MQKNLIVKRILSGLIDVIIIFTISKVMRMLGSSTGFTNLYYILALSSIKTTIGGAILGIKTVTPRGEEIKFFRTFLRSLLLTAALISFSLNLYHQEALILLAIIVLIAMPVIFTKKNLTLIDILSNSHVTEDSKKRSKNIGKWFSISLLIISILFIVGFSIYSSSKENYCVSLTKQKKYGLIIQECEVIASLSHSPKLHMLVAMAHINFEEYDKAINNLSIANMLGEDKAKILLASSYILNMEYDKAMNIAKTDLKKPQMLNMLTLSYAAQYNKYQDDYDLVNFYAHKKLLLDSDKDKKYKIPSLNHANTKITKTFKKEIAFRIKELNQIVENNNLKIK
mgnify:CR=1 FL=1